MGRFLNLESLLVAGALFAAGYAAARFGFHAGNGLCLGVAAAVAGLGFMPAAVWLQDKLVPFYVAHGMSGRALDLAIQIRDSAPTGKLLAMGCIDVALVHLARADFENALMNLRRTTPSQLPTTMRAVVLANTAYCLAHLGRELETAEAHADAARGAVPGEWVFEYIAGLAKLKRGKAGEALALIQRSIQTDPDPAAPLPGERDYMLAQALRATGDTKGAADALSRAAAMKGRFADLARAEAAA